LIQIIGMFPDDSAAEAWFIERRWPDGPYCPHCGSFNVQSDIKHKAMTHRCRDCGKRPMFSLKPGASVYTDDAAAYRGMAGFQHEAVNHSVGEYVRDMAHTNGIESFWAMLKRGYQGTFHHFSEKHMDRYIGEFAGRHNVRPLDTADQMSSMVEGMVGKRLRYPDLIAR